MKNIVVSIPQIEVHRPPISTTIIASVIQHEKQEVTCIDLNIELFKKVGNKEFYNLGNVWESLRVITDEEVKTVKELIKDKLISNIDDNTRVLISVFTYDSLLFAKMTCEAIREHTVKCQIVLGGQGVNSPGDARSGRKNSGEYFLRENLCDYVIFGEGETVLKEFLRGNVTYPGINSPENLHQVNDLDTLPFPNYKFYNLDNYDYLEEETEVNIVGSRGCVRKCTYCDVGHYWPKFRYRSGYNIADEMINHYEKHGITKFYFTDSLINGSLKAFNSMCEKLAVYNQQHDVGFSWSGQFIFKPKRQISDEYFDMIADAGGNTFFVGVETGSDKIRWEMDKKFSNEDIDYHLENFKRTGLHCFFLMIVGYLTETLQDHRDSLQMYERWQKYVASGTITGIDLNKTLSILSNTPLERMISSHGVKFLCYEKDFTGKKGPVTSTWESSANPELTFRERIRRRLEVEDTAIKYKWPIIRGTERLQGVYNLSKLFVEQENV